MSEQSRPVTPRPAATVVLVRDVADGVEVFMLQRDPALTFGGGAHVFPGGSVDRADRSGRLQRLVDDRDDAGASRRLGLESGGLAYWIAAIRECFEEAAVLLARDAAGVLLGGGTEHDGELEAARQRLIAGEDEFAAFCEDRGLTLAASELCYLSHWITPEAVPKRFDTRFFIAGAPPGQEARACQQETVAHTWIRPEEAIVRSDGGEIELMFPTRKTLESLSGYSSAAALLGEVRARAHVPAIQPRVVKGSGGIRVLLPGEPGYDDPQ